MKITINGKEVTGDPEDLAALVLGAALVERGNQYYSESKDQWIDLDDLNNVHLLNALVKHSKQYLDNDWDAFAQEQAQKLVKELQRRLE